MNNFLVEQRINFENITFPIRIKSFDKKSDLNHSTIIHKTLDSLNQERTPYRLTQVFNDNSTSASLVQKYVDSLKLQKNQVHQLRLRGVSSTGINSDNLSILFFYTDEGEVLLIGEFDEPITLSLVTKFFMDSIKDKVAKEVEVPIDDVIGDLEIKEEEMGYEILTAVVINYLFLDYEEGLKYIIDDMFFSEKLSFKTKEKLDKIAKECGMQESYAFKFAEGYDLTGFKKDFRAENVQFLFEELMDYHNPEITKQSEHALFEFVDSAIKEMDLSTKIMEEKLVRGIFRTVAFLSVNNSEILRDNIEVVEQLKTFISSILVKQNKFTDKVEIINLINTAFKILENQENPRDVVDLAVLDILSFFFDNYNKLSDHVGILNNVLDKILEKEKFVHNLKDQIENLGLIKDTQDEEMSNNVFRDKYIVNYIVSSFFLQEQEVLVNRDFAKLYVEYIEKSFFDKASLNHLADKEQLLKEIQSKVNIISAAVLLEDKFNKKKISEIFKYLMLEDNGNLEKIIINKLKEKSDYLINNKSNKDTFENISLSEILFKRIPEINQSDRMVKNNLREEESHFITKNKGDHKKLIATDAVLEYEGESCNIMGMSVMGESFMGCGNYSKVVDTVE